MKSKSKDKTPSARKKSSFYDGKSSKKSKSTVTESTPESVCQGTRSKKRGNIASTNLLPRIDEAVTVRRQKIDIANVEVRHHKDAADELSDIEESQESQDLLEETQVPSSVPPNHHLTMANRHLTLARKGVDMPPLEEDQADVEFENNNDADCSSSSGSSTGSSSGSSKVAGTDHHFAQYDECFDYVVAEEHSLPDKIVHFMRGEKISRSNRTAVELVLLCAANYESVTAGETRDDAQHAKIKKEYIELINSLPNSAFLSTAVKTAMLDGRKGCGPGLDGKNLQRQYKDFRTAVRKVFADLPTDYSSIPSGKQLYDIISDHIATIFKNNAKVCVILTRVFLSANILCLTVVLLCYLCREASMPIKLLMK